MNFLCITCVCWGKICDFLKEHILLNIIEKPDNTQQAMAVGLKFIVSLLFIVLSGCSSSPIKLYDVQKNVDPSKIAKLTTSCNRHCRLSIKKQLGFDERYQLDEGLLLEVDGKVGKRKVKNGFAFNSSIDGSFNIELESGSHELTIDHNSLRLAAHKPDQFLINLEGGHEYLIARVRVEHIKNLIYRWFPLVFDITDNKVIYANQGYFNKRIQERCKKTNQSDSFCHCTSTSLNQRLSFKDKEEILFGKKTLTPIMSTLIEECSSLIKIEKNKKVDNDTKSTDIESDPKKINSLVKQERSARENTLKKGFYFFDQDKYSEAYKILKPLAEEGEAMAQNILGVLYEFGKGVSKDDKQSFIWFQKAAKQDLPSAQYSLGHMYEYGRGVKQDYKEAFGWYLKAANQDLANAKYAIGLMYGKGKGLQRDLKQAVIWLEKAAAQGHKKSIEMLTSINGLRK